MAEREHTHVHIEKKPITVGGIIVTAILVIICILWTLPTLGTFISSFRTPDAINSSGWWKAFSTMDKWTLDKYDQVLFGLKYRGSSMRGENMIGPFLTSITVTLPAVIIPIFIAAAAAYGFAWLDFKGRGILLAVVIGLLVVPLQMSLVPVLRDYTKVGLNGTYLGIWLAHAGFGLPLATYMLYNYISQLPRSILESAFIDGASHYTTFTRLILPLSIPAIASFTIFQFIWVWNDMLVSLVFLSGASKGTQILEVITTRLNSLVGSRGTDWHFLTSGAFISLVLPLIVFLALQKYFVKGLLAGSVKG